MTETPDAITLTDIRRQFPHSLLRRGEAIRLLKQLGLSRYQLEQWCASPPHNANHLRVLIGTAKKYHYRRDALLRAAGLL